MDCVSSVHPAAVLACDRAAPATVTPTPPPFRPRPLATWQTWTALRGIARSCLVKAQQFPLDDFAKPLAVRFLDMLRRPMNHSKRLGSAKRLAPLRRFLRSTRNKRGLGASMGSYAQEFLR